MKAQNRNMLEGTPAKAIGIYATAMIFNLCLSQIASQVQLVIVGRGLSADALGGMGTVGSLNSLLSGYILCVYTGFATLVNIAYRVIIP